MLVGLVASIAYLIVAGCCSSISIEDEWKELNNQIFAKVDQDMEALKPTRTLELLKRFVEIITNDGGQLDRGKQLARKAVKAKSLLKQSEVSIERCNLNDMRELVSLIDSESGLVNIAPYLDSLRSLYYNQCHEPLIKILNSQVAKLTADQRKFVKDLKNSFSNFQSIDKILFSNNYKANSPPDMLKETIVNLVIRNKPNQERKPATIFREEVYKAVAICTESNKLIGNTTETYGYLLNLSKRSAESADYIGLQWVANFRICKRIVDNERYLKSVLF